jgi:hypothetical protein
MPFYMEDEQRKEKRVVPTQTVRVSMTQVVATEPVATTVTKPVEGFVSKRDSKDLPVERCAYKSERTG